MCNHQWAGVMILPQSILLIAGTQYTARVPITNYTIYTELNTTLSGNVLFILRQSKGGDLLDIPDEEKYTLRVRSWLFDLIHSMSLTERENDP